MSNPFFDRPILNSPYEYPKRHWELDADGQPTQKTIESRRRAEFITPIPKARKRKAGAAQQGMVFDEGKGLSTAAQQYDPTPIINELRQHVNQWRELPNPNQWQVTPETARLLQHWRHHPFGSVRPFFCQAEAVETAIWLTEVAPQSKAGKRFLEHLTNANRDANPELMRLALKLATGAGKTTVMAMLIAWQTINAVRRPGSKHFTRGFLVGPARHVGRGQQGQDRHHQFPRLQASGTGRTVCRRACAADWPHRRPVEHDRNRRPDDSAGHARPDGHEERPGAQ